MQGDLGNAIQYKVPVSGLVRERLVNSLKLSIVSVTLAVVAGIPLGVIGAANRGRWLDKLVLVVGVGGQALPSFWLGILLVFAFSVNLRLLPSSGMGSWEHYVLPGFTIGYFITAGATRLVRSSMLEVLNSEFVKVARAKGVPEWLVIWKHALRNALIPAVTFISLMFGIIIAASVTVETVFNWPGMGRLMFEALVQRDFPVLQGVVLIWSAIMIFLNLVVDLSYVFLDPRIRI